MSYFVKSGDKFKITSKQNLDLYERLPVGTYTVGVGCDGQFFLQTIEPFQLKGKIYGETSSQSDRIMRTFLDRTASTGVLLAGEKGSGKTLLAKYISIQAAKQSIPTIVINKNLHGEQFNVFLQSITQPTVILFDEYEKVYGDGEQEKMLTLLDGVYPSKKLFLLTCNDKWRVNSHMRNRPGRIFYLINFTGLSQTFISEYCQDNLIQKEHIGNICAIARLFSAFNFDMLQALVEEMNRYGEAPSESIKYLNTRPEFSSNKTYSIELTVDGKPIPKAWGVRSEWNGNPLLNPVSVSYRAPPTEKGARRPPKSHNFCPSDLNHLDAESGKILFKKENAELVLKEKKTGHFVNFAKLTSSCVNGAVTSAAKIEEGEGDPLDVPMAEQSSGDY